MKKERNSKLLSFKRYQCLLCGQKMANKVHFLRRLIKLTCAHNFPLVRHGLLKFTGMLDTMILGLYLRNLLIWTKWARLVHLFRLKSTQKL